MIGKPGLHTHRADLEIHVLQLNDLDVAGQFAKGHREVGAFHLTGQHVHQAGTRALETQDDASRILERPYEGLYFLVTIEGGKLVIRPFEKDMDYLEDFNYQKHCQMAI